MSLKLNVDVYVKKVDGTIQSTIESLKNVWVETGYQRDECERLLDNLVEKLNQVCCAELAAENQILEHVKQEVETKLDEYITLSAQLGKTVDRISPLKGKSNCADRLAELEKLITETKSKVTKRQASLDAELNTISKLQNELGNFVDAMQTCAPSDLPLSDAKYQALGALRAALDGEKQQRLEKMKGIIGICHALMKELVVFEEEALQPNVFKHVTAIKKFTEEGSWEFGLRLEDVVSLETEQESLSKEKESRRKELASSGAEIARLWTLLRVSTAEREEFQKSFKMNLSLDTIRKGRRELARLMEVRGTSLARVVGSIRSDIAVLWTELGVTKNEDKKRQFPGYFDSPDNLEDSAVCFKSLVLYLNIYWGLI